MSVREIWKLLWKYLHVMVIQVYKFVQVMGILKLDKSKFLQRKFLIMYNLNRIIFSLVASTLKESWLVYLPWSLSLSCHLAGVFPCVGEVSKTNRTPLSYHIIFKIPLASLRTFPKQTTYCLHWDLLKDICHSWMVMFQKQNRI